MKHLLTILLLTFTTLSYAQVNETELVGRSLTEIVQIEGKFDDYGYNNGSPYIAYHHENKQHGTVMYFKNNMCYKIYVVLDYTYKNEARIFLNNHYHQINRRKWMNLNNGVELYLLEVKDAITIKITD